MPTPVITAICVTFGRTAYLQSALRCYLDQKCDVPHELLILNTCPDQHIFAGQSGVQVINTAIRPPSLGHARNEAVKMALGQWIVIMDDDDSFLPFHLQNFASQITPGVDWLWLTKQFYAERYKIKGIVPGQLPCFAYSKRAWQEVGGYPHLTCGEDRGLVGKITERFNGKKVDLNHDQISFIYRWQNQVLNTSAAGYDQPGKMSAHERAGKDCERRMRIGVEPKGAITLTPKYFDVEPKAMVEEYFKVNPVSAPKKASIAVVQMGRLGDIINILPICRHIAENYQKPSLICSREFAAVLEGVSYIEPCPLPIKQEQVTEALAHARQNFTHVVNCTIHGKDYVVERETSHYNEEAWRLAGFKHKFYHNAWMPVFDKRDSQRESELASKLIHSNNPVLIVNMKSISSPFPEGPEVLAAIRETFASYCEILDVSTMVLPQFHDLLALIDRAAVVVTADTSLLHLASASTTPIVALVNPQPWLGSYVRGNKAARVPYSEWHQVIPAISHTINSPRNYALPNATVKVAPARRLFHAVERHVETNELARKEAAWRSWDAMYNGGVIPCHYWKYRRSAKDIGDQRTLPYLKDVLEFAMGQSGDDDIIFWTNDDIFCHRELPAALLLHVSLHDVCVAKRCEFVRELPDPANPASEFAARGTAYYGRDLFAATKKWLEERWDLIPDFILGASDFDLCLAALSRSHFGFATTAKNMEAVIHPAELPMGYISHVNHPAFWHTPVYCDTAPSQKHNRRLFMEWASLHCKTLQFNADNTMKLR